MDPVGFYHQKKHKRRPTSSNFQGAIRGGTGVMWPPAPMGAGAAMGGRPEISGYIHATTPPQEIGRPYFKWLFKGDYLKGLFEGIIWITNY